MTKYLLLKWIKKPKFLAKENTHLLDFFFFGMLVKLSDLTDNLGRIGSSEALEVSVRIRVEFVGKILGEMLDTLGGGNVVEIFEEILESLGKGLKF